MLKKGSVGELRAGAISKSHGHIALTMCLYPRGLSKTLVDVYVKALGPDKKLLDRFHAERERLGGNHNAAFLSCDYQRHFNLAAEGFEALKRLSELSAAQDVFLICQCLPEQRCHRELLLIMAKRWWGAKTEIRKFSYPDFEARLSDEPGVIS